MESLLENRDQRDGHGAKKTLTNPKKERRWK
jgi:hypothetical protein